MEKLKALTAYEDTNMYGGAHAINYPVALRAAKSGRDLVVHGKHYNGQNYEYYTFRVTMLELQPDGNVTGRVYHDSSYYTIWTATKELCEYALTGRI